ncbi:putative cutinase 3 [Colletotrichum trifolii]|uniref:cutinase n=1 Tax=Colletotrichum trifolii TaxID=5466 RepID=A0A4R8RCS8_COLTR|nr:putative cutinase 3 [Colletotrichum trifolii]
MKIISGVFFLLHCLSAASRATVVQPRGIHAPRDRDIHLLDARQEAATGNAAVENEVKDGHCKDFMFLFLRGSTQQANMGLQPGPQVAAYLRQVLTPERIAVQGVEYPATLQDNLCVNNQLCRPSEVTSASKQVRQYMDKCPKSKVVMAGYSQGAAMLSRLLSARLVEPEYRDRVLAAVTFGNTMQRYNHNTIPEIPAESVKMFCNDFDPVCKIGVPFGAIMPDHRDYRPSAKPAAEFMLQRLATVDKTIKTSAADMSFTNYESLGFKFHDLHLGAAKGTSKPFNDAEALSGLDYIGVVSLSGKGAARVDNIGVLYEDMAAYVEHGGKGGEFKRIDLKEGEYWTKTEMCNGKKKKANRIGYFRAETNKGSSPLELGTKTNDNCITYESGEGRAFVGMHGESGAEIDSLGLISYPIIE